MPKRPGAADQRVKDRRRLAVILAVAVTTAAVAAAALVYVFAQLHLMSERLKEASRAAAAVEHATAARDARASRQPGGFSWGRFSFAGDPVASDRFRQFLHE
jgi:hypothetical protein